MFKINSFQLKIVFILLVILLLIQFISNYRIFRIDDYFETNNFCIDLPKINSSKIILNLVYTTKYLRLINKIGNNSILNEQFSLTELENLFENHSVKLGGHWKPKSCISNYKIAIIVPYRDRLSNLKSFLLNMPLFLIRQHVEFAFFLVEPINGLKFNRGLLMNIGFIESLKSENNWNCFFFHDVDMLPESNLNLYKCDYELPIHYAVAVSSFDYK